MKFVGFVICLFLLIFIVNGSHFRGGSIVWHPLNNTPSGSSVSIQVRHRWSWRRSFAGCFCDGTTIASQGTIGDNTQMVCVSGNCSSWIGISTLSICTDYSANLDVSSGEKATIQNLPLNSELSIDYTSSAWFVSLVVGSSTNWYVTSRINTMIRPDGYINSSPIAVTLPIIYKQINTQHVHVVQMVDFDRTDILKCRWSTASGNINSYNECGGVCNGVPGALLISNNCTLQFTLTIANMFVAVAIQIEDYYNNAATTPMSSVPLQFLFYGYPIPSGCTTPPAIIGVRPNRACVGTPIGATVTEIVVVQTFCSATSIVEFITTSPVGMTKSAISNPNPGIYQITLSWVPSASQYGTQGLCAAAVDNSSIQSNQWCIAYLVGFTAPQFIQSSAAPVGNVYANQSVFLIQADKPVGRPSRNGTYIYFYDATTGGSLVQRFDCGSAPEVTYAGYTITIRFSVIPWITGHSYYITFDSGMFELLFIYIPFLNKSHPLYHILGVASGLDACGPESAPVTSSSYWTFNVLMPMFPSNATNTTTTTTVASNVSTTTTTVGDTNKGWKLVWEDNFDRDGSVDSEKWKFEYGADCDQVPYEERVYHTRDRLKDARCQLFPCSKNGRLIIEAHQEDFKEHAYTSARLTSKASWTYGRLQIRAQLPKGRGLYRGARVKETRIVSSIETAAYNYSISAPKTNSVIVDDIVSKFKIYTLDWTEDTIQIYVGDADNSLATSIFTYKKEGDSTKWPFDQAFYLAMGMSVLVNWDGIQGIEGVGVDPGDISISHRSCDLRWITMQILGHANNGWKLVWEDNFDSEGQVDSKKWKFDVGGNGWGNNELQYYTNNRLKNARCELFPGSNHGRLIIEAHREKMENQQYTSARLLSKTTLTYGRVQIRAKLPKGRGLWPALWMLPASKTYGDQYWPDNGEIDIMEQVGFDETSIVSSIHTKAHNHAINTQKTKSVTVNDAVSHFKIYTLDWDVDKIETYVGDDANPLADRIFTYKNEGDWTKWPFDKPFFIVMNIAVGGNWGGAKGIDDSIFPRRMEIDWVRFYQRR
ncbi:hypothetical protein I4U23_004215 [Adineta vaga]|nr:hypothetical protein I4U23_004215 [Adineta vaga]